MILCTSIPLCIVLLFLMLRYSMFLPATHGLPVLMYHNVSVDKEDSLTVKAGTLRKHFDYLKKQGYQAVSVRDIIAFCEKKTALPKKPVLISFDDGYINNFDLAYPLLKEYGLKAIFFIPTAVVGKTNDWDGGSEKIMTSDQLKCLDTDIVELGLHSVNHQNYRKFSAKEIEKDVEESRCYFNTMDIPVVPAFAYPYGGRPKDKTIYKSMIALFVKNDIKLAFRIGNRVNRLPLKNVYEIQRISIRGTDSMWTFMTKLTKGRVKQV
jgi:peptidoglycan/xylan/chitin deacetylase (PgdA/CDA1 family)